MIGALVLVGGVLLMAWRGGIRLAPAALQAVLITALFTAAYTLSDGMGPARPGSRCATLWLFTPDRAGDAAADEMAGAAPPCAP